MNKTLPLLIIFSTLFILPCRSQTLKIIDIQGKVLVKKGPSGQWSAPEKNIIVDKGAEIKTENTSVCIISFDVGCDNIIMLTKESHLYIEKDKPPTLRLLRGEIFSLIDDIGKIGAFEIKAAPARIKINGAGGLISVSKKEVVVKCFEDTFEIELVKQKGKISGERILEEGFGAIVKSNGVFSNFFELTDYDFSRWDEFTNNIGHIRANKGNNINIEEKLN